MELIEKAISHYGLKPVTIDILTPLMDEYNLESLNEAFFYHVRNILGGELVKMGDEYDTLLGFLKVYTRDDNEWCYYMFEDIDDYQLYKEFRIKIFNRIDKGIVPYLNFFELGLIDFVIESHNISDTNMVYYYMAHSQYEQIFFVTNGKKIKVMDRNYVDLESKPFLEVYKTMITQGYNIIPLGVPEEIVEISETTTNKNDGTRDTGI